MSSTGTRNPASKPAPNRKVEPAYSGDGAAKPRSKAAKGSAAPAAPRSTYDESADAGPVSGTIRYTAAQWRAMVAEAAYLKAERRGFASGSPEQDWLEAEEELRRTLGDVYEH